MGTLIKDFDFGFRTLRKNRVFAITAILTIGLGLGASSAIFSVVNAVLLRPLPYRDADRLVHVWPDLRNRNVRDFQSQPMTTFVDRAMAPTEFALFLVSVFAVIAIVLAAVGLYGVLSTTVRQRTAEIGVRMAFGAHMSTIFKLVLVQGMRLGAIGLALGLAGAAAATQVMRTMLVGVTPTDPATFAGIATLFMAVAAVACWVPARRAARLNPMTALRDE